MLLLFPFYYPNPIIAAITTHSGNVAGPLISCLWIDSKGISQRDQLHISRHILNDMRQTSYCQLSLYNNGHVDP